MRTLFTIFFILFVITVKSQQIVITILNADNSKPIPYAHICTKNFNNENEKYQAADLDGKRKINIKEKTIIYVSCIGYETISDTILPGTTQKKYKLKRTGFDIEEVVVTGQYEPVAVDKSIYDIKIIGRTQIENKAANNLADLLTDELGINISHDPSTGTGIKMQGISGENVKILIDGVPVIGRMNGNIDLSQIDLSNVDHVEIIEGPMSVIYGSNALAGVINIITKENKYSKFKTGANLYYESGTTYNANTNVSFNKNKHLIYFNGGRKFFAGFDVDDTNRKMDYKPKEQYNADANYTFGTVKFKIKYKIDFFKEKLLDRSDLFGLQHYSIKGLDTWFYTIRTNNNLQINHKLTENSNYNFLAAYSYYNRKKHTYIKDMTNLETQLTTGSTDHDTTKFDAIITRYVYNYVPENINVNFHAGFDFNLEYGTGKRMKNNKEDIQDYALFTGIMWNILPNFVIQSGLRASYNTKYNSPLVPSFNLKYNIKKLNIRASYARGFRAPSLKELYLYFYDSNHQIEGNEDLNAEYSHNYNLSTNYNITSGKNKFDFEIKTYYNIINNKITLAQVSPDNQLHFTNSNIGHFKSIGVEANIGYKYLPFFKIDMGFSRIGQTDSYDEDSLIFSNNFNSILTYNFLKLNGTLSIIYKYIGEYPSHTLTSEDLLLLNIMDSYHNLDITISKKFFNNSIVISAGAKNIFDNIEISGTQTGASQSGGAHGSTGGISSLAGRGRIFFVSLKMNITKY